MFRTTNVDCIHHTFDTMMIALKLDKVNSLSQNSKKKTCKFVQCNRKMIHRMFKNTIKQFLYLTLQEKVNAINILGKYVYCAGGSIARNSGAVNKKLTIQGECVKKQRGKEQNGQKIRRRPGCGIGGAPDRKVTWNNLLYAVDGETIGRARSPDRAGAVRKQKIRFVAARHPSKRAPIRGRNDSQIFLGHLAQSPGMVETIPYRLVYNV